MILLMVAVCLMSVMTSAATRKTSSVEKGSTRYSPLSESGGGYVSGSGTRMADDRSWEKRWNEIRSRKRDRAKIEPEVGEQGKEGTRRRCDSASKLVAVRVNDLSAWSGFNNFRQYKRISVRLNENAAWNEIGSKAPDKRIAVCLNDRFAWNGSSVYDINIRVAVFVNDPIAWQGGHNVCPDVRIIIDNIATILAGDGLTTPDLYLVINDSPASWHMYADMAPVTRIAAVVNSPAFYKRRRGFAPDGIMAVCINDVCAWGGQGQTKPDLRIAINAVKPVEKSDILNTIVATAVEMLFNDERGATGKIRKEITGSVSSVIDGDTISIHTPLGQHKVRLDHIDAPELDQPFGKESASHLNQLIAGKKLRVEYDTVDQYGRILGTVFCGSIDINFQMIKNGYAWHYKYSGDSPSYAEAERRARETKRGLWAKPNPISPYQWRKQHHTN